MESLLELMDISVIPEYLGGHNKRTYRDDLEDEKVFLREQKNKHWYFFIV